jgi:hypothetical protein
VIHKGDCLSCKKVGSCTGTDAQKVYSGFTCQLFEGVPEAEYLARLDTMKKYGESQAIQAMLNRPLEIGDDEDA